MDDCKLRSLVVMAIQARGRALTSTQNVRGPYLMTRSLLPLMLKGGDKQIINLTSIGAHLLFPGFSSYQTGKLAIIRFSEFINADYGEQGVVSFSVHPGGVRTEMGLAMPEHTHSSEWNRISSPMLCLPNY